ncbi:serine/threonine protein kinase [Nocardia speluncae]|uniref:non-specific serine/threonine protein kinase n=1 Tax=Nocardia speluncae TaxID=419477 RepID=A0A846XC77_9NOCA|nr:serine/threonine-protein kinase [Nocardia speluncae]NKY33658.1 serine/threonine protein kinase [Nocardia speluncae]
MLGVGATFAGYRIEGILGQGGMGTVYLARHPRLPRSVALKLLNREVSTDPELSRRFEREADVIARLEHPAIVGIYDRGTDDGHLWIAMQYVRGTDASAWDAAAHPAMTTVRLITETAVALDYAHSRGVLHRDVKPANILIADSDDFRENHAVLTDFGIARLTDADNTKVTATGTFTATLAYGSPEQLSGEPVDHRSDQYSLACTLFAVFAGHPPYASTNPGQVVMGHISKPPPRLTESRPDLPAGIDGVLARAMAKHRDDRFATCTEFVDAVRDAFAGRPIAADPARSAPTVHNAAPGGYATPVVRNGNGMVAAPQRDARLWAPGDPRAAPNAHPAVGGPGKWREPTPPKATPITMGILTLLFGLLFAAVFVGGLARSMTSANSGDVGSKVAVVVFLLLTLLWNSAAILLLAGRHAGRILTAICWGIGVAVCVAALIWMVLEGSAERGPVTLYLWLLVLSGSALAGAAGRATKRWVEYRTRLRLRTYRF